jgi:hypothetical protein
MMHSTDIRDRNPADVVNILAGLGLALSPWFLEFTTATAAALNAWIVGAAIALIALSALCSYHRTEEWVNGLLGLWAVIAPWVLGFSELGPVMSVHVVLGLLVAIVAAALLWSDDHRPHSTA